ncbi:MAG: oligosaccharide flippase family protein [Halobacteriota archaeon]
MSENVNQSLQKIAKGTGIIFTGTIIGMLLAFVSRVIIVRYTTQSEYGIYSLALVIISIFVTISTLGLQQGSTRYIAYFRGKNEERYAFVHQSRRKWKITEKFIYVLYATDKIGDGLYDGGDDKA